MTGLVSLPLPHLDDVQPRRLTAQSFWVIAFLFCSPLTAFLAVSIALWVGLVALVKLLVGF